MQPLFILRPNIVNALTPMLFKYGFRSLVINSILILILRVAHIYDVIYFPLRGLFISAGIGFASLAIGPLAYKTFILNYTKYYFFRTHIMSEFRFIKIKRFSVAFSHIVNVTTKVSLWDRMCKAGDVVLHTAEDSAPDLTLHYIKDPERVEEQIFIMMRDNGSAVKDHPVHRT